MCMCQQGGEIAHDSKGERHTKGERYQIYLILSACIHLGDCICSGGVALELLLLDVLSLYLFWRV
jgi:hypothetical protein